MCPKISGLSWLALVAAFLGTVEGFVPPSAHLSGRARGFASGHAGVAPRGGLVAGTGLVGRRPRSAGSRAFAQSGLLSSGMTQRTDVQKVAVIGSGAVGLYYGARLKEAGHDVSFLCRRDLDAIKSGGLTVESVDGDMRFAPVDIKVFGSSDEIGPVDWVVLSLKSYSLRSAAELVQPVMGPKTRILAIMNGYGIEATLARTFSPDRIFGGMAFICSNRGDPGVVLHQKYGALLIGHFQDRASELEQVRRLFSGANVQVSTSQSILCSRWDKLCWNIPFNGLAVAMGGITTDQIVTDPNLREVAYDLMKEVVDAANEDLKISRVPKHHRLDKEEVLERMFSLTDSMGVYKPSTMLDLVEGKPMEVEYMFSNPLGRALELDIKVPKMEVVINMIKAQQRLRNL